MDRLHGFFSRPIEEVVGGVFGDWRGFARLEAGDGAEEAEHQANGPDEKKRKAEESQKEEARETIIENPRHREQANRQEQNADPHENKAEDPQNHPFPVLIRIADFLIAIFHRFYPVVSLWRSPAIDNKTPSFFEGVLF